MAATEGLPQYNVGAAKNFYPVTTADGTDLAIETRAIIIAVGGTLKVTTTEGTDVTLTLPPGIFPLRVRRIWATGTSATGITALT